MHKASKELTNAGKKLASDDTFRFIKDKAQAALEFDNLGKACVKASSRDHGPPKEKHVQTLLEACHHGTSSIQEILTHLFARLHEKDATVVLKALMVLHRLLRDTSSSAKVFQCVVPHMGELRVSRFMDDSSHESMQASQMVRSYALYMEEKLCVLRTAKFEYDKPSSDLNPRINRIAPKDLIRDLTAAIPQLEAGYKCTVQPPPNPPPVWC